MRKGNLRRFNSREWVKEGGGRMHARARTKTHTQTHTQSRQRAFECGAHGALCQIARAERRRHFLHIVKRLSCIYRRRKKHPL